MKRITVIIAIAALGLGCSKEEHGHNVGHEHETKTIPTTPATASDSTAFDKAMQPLLENYLRIQTALAGDSTDGVKGAAQAIAQASAHADPKTVTGEHADHFKELPARIKASASKLGGAADIEASRAALKDLSKPMVMWATMSKPADVDVVYCSMAKGSWLQKKGDIRNPYYGASMLDCGEVVADKR